MMEAPVASSLPAGGGPPVYLMSKYHPTTHATDRILTPAGVLKLSSGDCRDLLSSDDGNGTVGQKRGVLLGKINQAPHCKVTWGTTLSRRKQHIDEILHRYPELKEKLYCATPFEEAHATAISCKMEEDVRGVHIMVAFGGSCLHVLSVNQLGDVLTPGSNAVSRGIPRDLREILMEDAELFGRGVDWIPGCRPPMLPDEQSFYTTFPLDRDLSRDQFLCLARLFEGINALMAQFDGASYLVCGAPTNINPGGKWWPDKLPRTVRTSFKDLAEYAALNQVKDDATGIATGGLLCERHQVLMKGRGRVTTVHELVLTAMATPQLPTPEYFGVE